MFVGLAVGGRNVTSTTGAEAATASDMTAKFEHFCMDRINRVASTYPQSAAAVAEITRKMFLPP